MHLTMSLDSTNEDEMLSSPTNVSLNYSPTLLNHPIQQDNSMEQEEQMSSSQEHELLNSPADRSTSLTPLLETLGIEMTSCSEPSHQDCFADLDALMMELISSFSDVEQQDNFTQRFKLIKSDLRKHLKQSPLRGKTRAKTFVLEDFLKHNLRRQTSDILQVFTISSVEEGLRHIKEIKRNIENSKSNILFNYILIGDLCFKIKKMKPRNLIRTFNENGVSYSLSFINFLIKLSKFVEEFPKFQFVHLDITFIKNNFKEINTQVRNNAEFWKL